MATPGLPMAAPAAAARPLQLGKYQILRQLATGGMAEIYLARHSGNEGFEKLVVVKRILPQLAADPGVVQMFLDEGRLAATLQHSNVVQVFDSGCEDGSYFLAMEFLHGEDLGHVMKALRAKGRTLPLEHAVAIALGVCAGLHYAHERTGSDGQPLEIVHRDVTPQNVFVTYEGAVKLVDFGIAKASRRATATRYGTLKGKIHYMSPEQARCLPLDRRSDVFAAGILLWELTTGRRLFGGPSEFDTLRTIIETDAPPPSGVTPDCPRGLEQIILRALRRPREERYQTAQEMQLALEEFALEHKLRVSSVALAGFMGELFEGKITAWREAQRLGTSFADHIVGSIVREGDDLPWLEETDPQCQRGQGSMGTARSVSLGPPTGLSMPPPPRALGVAPTAGASLTRPWHMRRWSRVGRVVAAAAAVLLAAGGGWLVIRSARRGMPDPTADAGIVAVDERLQRLDASGIASPAAPLPASGTSTGTVAPVALQPAGLEAADRSRPVRLRARDPGARKAPVRAARPGSPPAPRRNLDAAFPP